MKEFIAWTFNALITIFVFNCSRYVCVFACLERNKFSVDLFPIHIVYFAIICVSCKLRAMASLLLCFLLARIHRSTSSSSSSLPSVWASFTRCLIACYFNELACVQFNQKICMATYEPEKCKNYGRQHEYWNFLINVQWSSTFSSSPITEIHNFLFHVLHLNFHVLLLIHNVRPGKRRRHSRLVLISWLALNTDIWLLDCCRIEKVFCVHFSHSDYVNFVNSRFHSPLQP